MSCVAVLKVPKTADSLPQNVASSGAAMFSKIVQLDRACDPDRQTDRQIYAPTEVSEGRRSVSCSEGLSFHPARPPTAIKQS